MSTIKNGLLKDGSAYKAWLISVLVVASMLLYATLSASGNTVRGVNLTPFLDLRSVPTANLKLYFITLFTEMRLLNSLVPSMELLGMLANILVFIPFAFFLTGFIDCLLIRCKSMLAFMVACLFSLFIEFAQLMIPTRTSDIDDLILNSVGIVLGLMLFNMMRYIYFPLPVKD